MTDRNEQLTMFAFPDETRNLLPTTRLHRHYISTYQPTDSMYHPTTVVEDVISKFYIFSFRSGAVMRRLYSFSFSIVSRKRGTQRWSHITALPTNLCRVQLHIYSPTVIATLRHSAQYSAKLRPCSGWRNSNSLLSAAIANALQSNHTT